MCPRCAMASDSEFPDISERFDLRPTDYADQPLAGWAMCSSCATRFAFSAIPMIGSRLWHWVLVVAPDTADSLAQVIDSAKEQRASWISIVEDRRVVRTGILRGACMEGTPIPEVSWEIR
jgi:hypothetical protein